MKKIYLCALALSVGTLSFAQRTNVRAFSEETLRKVTPEDLPLKNIKTNNKAPGDVIWSEDFTSGIPVGWTIVDNTGNGFDWILNSAAINNTASGTGGGFTNTGAILSTSGGNHMLLFGDNYNANGGTTQHDSYFQTSAITLTGQSSVSVRFEHKFRLCCSAAAALNLVVSDDPTFTNNVFTYDARGATAINAATVDPEAKSINISDNFAGFNGDIYLRFHWASGASHYYWMIDDIEVIETVSNDLVISEGYYGFNGVPYTRIPVAHIQPADFSAEVTNVGAVDQTNTFLTVDINNGLYTGTSTPSTITALALGGTVAATTDSLFPSTQYTPSSTIGVPNVITMYAVSDSTDFTPGNDSTTFEPFEVSQYIYALDDFGANGTGNAGGDNTVSPGAFEFEAGNFFDAVVNDVVTSVDVVVGTNTVAGTVIDGVLYELDGTGSFVEIARSGFYTTTAADAGNLVSLALDQLPGTVVAGGNYFVAVHAFTEFFYGTSGRSPGQGTPGGTQSFIFYPNMSAPNTGENFFTTNTPMVRANFDPTISIAELNEKVSFSVSPNPSSDLFNIKLDAKATENVNLSVRNIVGQIILTKQLTVSGQTTETISLANYDKGVYFLTIDNNNEKKTTKLIVQ